MSRSLFLLSPCIFLMASGLGMASEVGETKEGNPLQNKGVIELKTDKTVLSLGGRIDLQSMYTSPEGSFFAGKIPLEKDSIGENGQLFMSARDSRLWVKTRTPTKYGVARAIIETDFWGDTTNANEKNTNSYGVRLRHVYVNIAGFTVGQTNSAFNSTVMLDTITHTINETLVRQPLIRYSIDNYNYAYDISFEQPETTLINSSATMITPKDDVVPDVILRMRYYPSWGEFSFAAMGRYITQDRADINSSTRYLQSDGKFGHAYNLSLRINTFTYDDIRFDAQYGSGLGRYLAYSAFAAGSVDDNGNIKLQESYGGHLAYRHWWNLELRSTFAISYAATQNNLEQIQAAQLDKLNKDVKALQVNLLYSPVKNALVGLEYSKAIRRVESLDEGVIELATLMFRYEF